MAGTAEAVKEIFSAMPTNFNADAAKGMNSVIQFNLSGDGGGNYHVDHQGRRVHGDRGHACVAEHDDDAWRRRTTST